MTDHSDSDLSLAFAMADKGDAIALERFRSLDLVVDTKPDLTPVSDADRAVEQSLRADIAAERPDDAVLGEEFGTTGRSDRRWIIDPIDGTKNYVRGVPTWATLIALVTGAQPDTTNVVGDPLGGGELVLGLVSAPALHMRWWATKGAGAWAQSGNKSPRRIHVSGIGKLNDASVSYSDWNDTAWDATKSRSGFQQLLETTWRSRAFGDFWSHMLVAEGAMDVAVEPQLSAWDMAALIPIVREAGGRTTSIRGGDAMKDGNALTTNGALHDQVVELLEAQPLPPS